MTKQDLLNAFKTIKTNLTLALSLLPVLDRPEYYEIIGRLAEKNPHIPPFLENLKSHKKQIKYYYFTTQMLNTIQECLEITKKYCCQNRKSHNYNKFYSNDTITFARFIRSCITHELTFSFKSRRDRDKVTNNPPKWRGKAIDISLDGKKFDKNFMNHQDIIELLNDLEAIAKNEIK